MNAAAFLSLVASERLLRALTIQSTASEGYHVWYVHFPALLPTQDRRRALRPSAGVRAPPTEPAKSASSAPSRRIVAVKCIEMPYAAQRQSETRRSLDDPLQERRVSDLLVSNGGHPNVVRAYSHYQENRTLYLVNEFCADGDLYNHLTVAHNGTMSENQSVQLMRQILAGVDYLHREIRIAHRDLSLENVLMHNGVCKISDFGLSVTVNCRCSDRVGKEYYMAPEVVAGEEYDPAKADVWSLGIMWFVMLTGSPLVSIASRKNKPFVAFEQIGVAAVFKSWKADTKLTAKVVDLVSRMLKVNPAERFSIDEVLQHPVFKTW